MSGKRTRMLPDPKPALTNKCCLLWGSYICIPIIPPLHNFMLCHMHKTYHMGSPASQIKDFVLHCGKLPTENVSRKITDDNQHFQRSTEFSWNLYCVQNLLNICSHSSISENFPGWKSWAEIFVRFHQQNFQKPSHPSPCLFNGLLCKQAIIWRILTMVKRKN